MSQHLNPLEKEFLIKRYKSNPTIKLKDFCINNDLSETVFRKWLKQYEEHPSHGHRWINAYIGIKG